MSVPAQLQVFAKHDLNDAMDAHLPAKLEHQRLP